MSEAFPPLAARTTIWECKSEVTFNFLTVRSLQHLQNTERIYRMPSATPIPNVDTLRHVSTGARPAVCLSKTQFTWPQIMAVGQVFIFFSFFFFMLLYCMTLALFLFSFAVGNLRLANDKHWNWELGSSLCCSRNCWFIVCVFVCGCVCVCHEKFLISIKIPN